MKMITNILAFGIIAFLGFCQPLYAAGNSNETEWQDIAINELLWASFVPKQGTQNLVRLDNVKIVFSNIGTDDATAQILIGNKIPSCKLLNRDGRRPILILVLDTSTDPTLQVPLRELAEGGGNESNISGDPVKIGSGVPTRGYLAFQGYCN
jgi:hypothetical protein